MNRSYQRNAAYLSHGNISSINLDVNGNSIASLRGSFPDEIASIFHNTLINIKQGDNLLSHQLFKEGRTIYMFDLRPSACDDVITVERSGNVRLNIQTTSPLDENIIIFAIGTITGVFDIDGIKRVKTSYLL